MLTFSDLAHVANWFGSWPVIGYIAFAFVFAEVLRRSWNHLLLMRAHAEFHRAYRAEIAAMKATARSDVQRYRALRGVK